MYEDFSEEDGREDPVHEGEMSRESFVLVRVEAARPLPDPCRSLVCSVSEPSTSPVLSLIPTSNFTRSRRPTTLPSRTLRESFLTTRRSCRPRSRPSVFVRLTTPSVSHLYIPPDALIEADLRLSLSSFRSLRSLRIERESKLSSIVEPACELSLLAR